MKTKNAEELIMEIDDLRSQLHERFGKNPNILFQTADGKFHTFAELEVYQDEHPDILVKLQ